MGALIAGNIVVTFALVIFAGIWVSLVIEGSNVLKQLSVRHLVTWTFLIEVVLFVVLVAKTW
jgi:hypothetical protein